MKFEYVVGFLFFTHIFSISNAGGGRKKSKEKEKKEVRNINAERSSTRREEKEEAHNINAEGSSSSLHEMQEPEEDTRSLEQSQDVWGLDEDEFTRGLRLYREMNPELVGHSREAVRIAGEDLENFVEATKLMSSLDRIKNFAMKQERDEQMRKLYCSQYFLELFQEGLAKKLDSIQESRTQLTQVQEEYVRELLDCKDYLPQEDEELIRSLEQSVANFDQEYGEYKQGYEEYKRGFEETIRSWQRSNWEKQLTGIAAEYGSSSTAAAAANLPKLDASSTENEETKEKNSDSEK